MGRITIKLTIFVNYETLIFEFCLLFQFFRSTASRKFGQFSSALLKKILIFHPFSVVCSYQRFGEIVCLHRKVVQEGYPEDGCII